MYIIRYLRKNTEETGNAWSGEMISLLCGMNKRQKELMERGAGAMPAGMITDYEGKYFSVLFDDNISERDLRKAKNRQKMAGGFRKESGHKMYCSIMAITETLKKRNMGMIENIKRPFMGTLAIF